MKKQASDNYIWLHALNFAMGGRKARASYILGPATNAFEEESKD